MLTYQISQDRLTGTIEALLAYQLRLEAEAAALAQASQDCPEALQLAQERAKQAAEARSLFDYFVAL